MTTRQTTAAANAGNNAATATSVIGTNTAVTASTDIAATAVAGDDTNTAHENQSSSSFASTEPEEEFNLEDYLAEVSTNSKRVIRTREELEALNATDVTKGHYNRAGKLERKFLEGLAAISKCDKNE